jgi:hypothetical protein|tara:strand:- start:149 stop:370 length:222 start_codon:yes stop_codon:yes gene_type:complete
MADRLIDFYVVIRDEGRQLKNSGENLSPIAGVNGGVGTILSLRQVFESASFRSCHSFDPAYAVHASLLNLRSS